MDLSVIICTHNPRQDYLRRVLEALKAQTLPAEKWELLLIDNASNLALAGTWDLSWQPHSRHIREEELGLTPARLRGIRESRGNLLVFVDDDNVAAPNYLEKATEIDRHFPFLGAWGGRIVAEYEVPPPAGVHASYLEMLGLREIERDCWSNLLNQRIDTLPWGAGICIRRDVAVHWAKSLQGDRSRSFLGRKGANLMSGEDVDMALTSIDCGLGTGVFRRLQITHLIPATRLRLNYLLKLREAIFYSDSVLWAARGRPVNIAVKGFFRRSLGSLQRFLTMNAIDRQFAAAWERGRQRYARESLERSRMEDRKPLKGGGLHQSPSPP